MEKEHSQSVPSRRGAPRTISIRLPRWPSSVRVLEATTDPSLRFELTRFSMAHRWASGKRGSRRLRSSDSIGGLLQYRLMHEFGAACFRVVDVVVQAAGFATAHC